MIKIWHCPHCGYKLYEKDKELHCQGCTCVYLLHTGPWLTSSSRKCFTHEAERSTSHEREFLAHIRGEPMLEPEVGETFMWAGRNLKAVAMEGCSGCFGSIKGMSGLCPQLKCESTNREDGRGIVAVEWPVR